MLKTAGANTCLLLQVFYKRERLCLALLATCNMSQFGRAVTNEKMTLVFCYWLLILVSWSFHFQDSLPQILYQTWVRWGSKEFCDEKYGYNNYISNCLQTEFFTIVLEFGAFTVLQGFRMFKTGQWDFRWTT